jgi:TonB family protein
VDTAGWVDPVRIAVLRSDHREFTTAALNVVTGMKFLPATSGTRPVPVWINVPVTFALAREPAP